MSGKFYADKSGYLQIMEAGGKPKLVPFPVCLAIKHEDNIAETCPDFILNLLESWVFICTDNPLPEGDSLLMHFYIPPEDKLLAAITGSVIARHKKHMQYPSGMLVSFDLTDRAKLKILEEYIDGKKHLVDTQV